MQALRPAVRAWPPRERVPLRELEWVKALGLQAERKAPLPVNRLQTSGQRLPRLQLQEQESVTGPLVRVRGPLKG